MLSFFTDNPTIYTLAIIGMTLLVSSFAKYAASCAMALAEHGMHGFTTPNNTCSVCGTPKSKLVFLPIIGGLFELGLQANCPHPHRKSGLFSDMFLLASTIFIFYEAPVSPEALTGFILIWGLTVLMACDIAQHLLPDLFTKLLLWGGLLLAAFEFSPLAADASIIGTAIGFLLLAGIQRFIFVLFGRVTLGAGDIKYMAAAGAFIGAQNTVTTLVIATTICAFTMLIHRMAFLRTKQEIAFGPFLCVATMIVYAIAAFTAAGTVPYVLSFSTLASS
jgi:leader peptidase (prepilin peptidase)/N-methyltransferase